MSDLNVNSQLPVGMELALAVADRLDEGQVLLHSHRDFCGMGIAKDEDTYVYAAVYDGYPPTIADIRTEPQGQKFDSREAFVTWLAAQSDESLDGRDQAREFFRGNQRITLARLALFAKRDSLAR